jgi:chorismate synthase
MLRFMTAGESHGRGLVAILEGLPSNLRLDTDFINQELCRRQEGFGRSERMSIEKDTAQIISGIRAGITLGSPLSILIENHDFSLEREALPPLLSPRPGHADLSGVLKYNFRDCRNVWERASARSSASIVALGAVAKTLLYQFNITILSHVISIGRVSIKPPKKFSYEELFLQVEKSPLRVCQNKAEASMIREIEKAKKKGDTLGGAFEVIGIGVPVGLGSYTELSMRLDGRIANAIMSIPSVKGVEIGEGFSSSMLFGSEVHDEIYYNNAKKIFFRKTNHAGGIEGGMSNGEPIVVRGYMKPISTLKKPLSSINIKTKTKCPAEAPRGDTCAVPAGGIIGEAVLALEIARAMHEKFGGDSLGEMKRNFKGYIRQIRR